LELIHNIEYLGTLISRLHLSTYDTVHDTTHNFYLLSGLAPTHNASYIQQYSIK
jgi:hypothetical protein